ncbi:hypothetical protein DyAD56_16055 [Dyella sp. AD56]|uniref:hypothetical protein n=1 Tax=Dyella sp. AD56 TaxID=1528744 RepID=UPI000C82852E|nr:hypothetical protein [Dyella sp. AD56]PMQ04202.1 hypothetical protein DyAD56_16055 [Dyella sp. AD56]
MNRTPDLFDGIFDNQSTGRREVWLDGNVTRHARRNAVGDAQSNWREMRAPWGSYPDLPANASAPI